MLEGKSRLHRVHSRYCSTILLSLSMLHSFGCAQPSTPTRQGADRGLAPISTSSLSPDDQSPPKQALPETGGSPAASASGVGLDQLSALASAETDTRSAEAILCENGPRIVAEAKKADFSEELKVICDGSKMTPALREALENTYRGSGDPYIKILSKNSSDFFLTELYLIFGFRTKVPNPTHLTQLKLHDQLASIKSVNSKTSKRSALGIKVTERNLFPVGSISVESLKLNYNLSLASNSSIYDVRDTEINNYGLSDTRKEVALGTEHLIDPESNEYYHDAKNLTVSISMEPGTTDVVFLNHLIIKNRIDPIRLEQTLVDLNQVVSKTLYDFVESTAKE